MLTPIDIDHPRARGQLRRYCGAAALLLFIAPSALLADTIYTTESLLSATPTVIDSAIFDSNSPPLTTPAAPAPPLRPPAAALATAHPLATAAGADILAAGGNAFDAAVTVSAVLAVVEPYSSGLGGGGFWLLHRAYDAHEVMIDGRERAPLAATADLYLDANGEVVPRLSVDGALAAAIPGLPAALVHIAERYGRLPLPQLLAPAIAAARSGFVVTPHYQRMARFRLNALRASEAAAAQFLVGGEVPPLGHQIRQPDLALTLERLAVAGLAGFYQGATAEQLVTAVRAAGGIWQMQDLSSYRVVEREPVVGYYRGHRISSAAPPSSGGVALLQILNMLAEDDLTALDPVQRSHLITEAMRRAYRDRAHWLGDPDAVSIPLQRLTHPFYAAGLRATIHPAHATASADLPGYQAADGGSDTTHFSILDRDGNRVAATLSINYPFGSGFVAAGTGLLLNDEMDDFVAKPGVANLYGLVGATANAIAPGKRMLSSMSPTFVTHDDRVAIIGTPGGSRIITMVLHAILAAIDGAPVETWVTQRRFHHQYLPDQLLHEAGAFSAEQQQRLRARGHHLQQVDDYGNMQALLWDRKRQQVSVASDPRGEGSALRLP